MSSPAPQVPSENNPLVSADEALRWLIEGNARYVRGESKFTGMRPEVLADLAKGQQPFATVLGCSDARVPPELIFDAVLGELFVIRVAGNVLSPEVVGSLQYAGVHLSMTTLFDARAAEAIGGLGGPIGCFAPYRASMPTRAAALKTRPGDVRVRGEVGATAGLDRRHARRRDEDVGGTREAPLGANNGMCRRQVEVATVCSTSHFRFRHAVGMSGSGSGKGAEHPSHADWRGSRAQPTAGR